MKKWKTKLGVSILQQDQLEQILRKTTRKYVVTPLLQFSALCDLSETKKKLKIFQKFRIFVSIFPHAGTVEETT